MIMSTTMDAVDTECGMLLERLSGDIQSSYLYVC